MKKLIMLLAATGIVAAAVVIARRRWRLGLQNQWTTSADPDWDDEPYYEAELVFDLVDGDPLPLAQTVGDGFDVDALDAAYRGVELVDWPPVHSKDFH